MNITPDDIAEYVSDLYTETIERLATYAEQHNVSPGYMAIEFDDQFGDGNYSLYLDYWRDTRGGGS